MDRFQARLNIPKGESFAIIDLVTDKNTGEKVIMDVFKFGMHYWKRHLPIDILNKLLSCVILGADLCFPMLTSLFIDYCILDNTPQADTMFSFLLTKKYGAVHSMELFLRGWRSYAGALYLQGHHPGKYPLRKTGSHR